MVAYQWEVADKEGLSFFYSLSRLIVWWANNTTNSVCVLPGSSVCLSNKVCLQAQETYQPVSVYSVTPPSFHQKNTWAYLLHRWAASFVFRCSRVNNLVRVSVFLWTEPPEKLAFSAQCLMLSLTKSRRCIWKPKHKAGGAVTKNTWCPGRQQDINTWSPFKIAGVDKQVIQYKELWQCAKLGKKNSNNKKMLPE